MNLHRIELKKRILNSVFSLILVACMLFTTGCDEYTYKWLHAVHVAGFNAFYGSNTATTIDDQSTEVTKVPEYSGEPYIEINGNVPYFEASEMTTKAFEYYSKLDSLGRCGVAYANICKELMPTEKRGSIGMIKPAGWHLAKYEGVDGLYLYNRCHLIGFQLAGENANERNLITGTRYMNVTGMLPFEDMVDDYVDETENHVLYRVTPIYVGDNLLCDGVLMEAKSVEDDGEGLEFCVFCYNVQPDIHIDYATGDNWREGHPEQMNGDIIEPEVEYVGNKNTKKFHLPDCDSVIEMNQKNRKDFYSRKEAVDAGYEPCGNCKP